MIPRGDLTLGILAGGRGSRLGGRDKAWLQRGGIPQVLRIAQRFVATAEREYRASGKLLEKYDVEESRAGGGGEYPLQDGFGWTNGVLRKLIVLYPEAARESASAATADVRAQAAH